MAHGESDAGQVLDDGRPLRTHALRRRSATDRRIERERLGFVRQPKVRWLSPGILVRAAIDVAVSSAFGKLADKREVFRSVPQPPFDYSGRDGELWIDFLSDTGDSFEATYTMAWLLAQPSLRVAGLPRDEAQELPAGDLLLLGGDQVYPAASAEAYEDRFLGPFRAALPRPRRNGPTHLYAIPGNHDWYDGLTAFTRIFCKPGSFAGWHGSQTRSYWALKLPHDWWIWAIDIQLDTYVDNAQIEYFEQVGKDVKRGDRLILLTAKPSWVKPDFEPASWRNLTYFEERVIAKTKARLVLTLTGDLHHYSRYEPEERGEGPVRITAGGGGAYMSCTHTLPRKTELQPLRSPGEAESSSGQCAAAVVYKRAAKYPPTKDSRSMAVGVFKVPISSPWFCVLLGAIYALLAAAVLGALNVGERGLAAEATQGNFIDFLGLAVSGTTLILVALLCVALSAYADFRKPDPRNVDVRNNWLAKLGVGVPHGLGHVGAVAALAYAVVEIYSAHAAGILIWLTTLPLCFVAGYLGGSLLFAFILYTVHVTRGLKAPLHANDVFASQGIVDWKNFLRMHLDRSGELTVYPLGVDRVCRRWREANGRANDPVLEPDGEDPSVHLIEKVRPLD